MPSRKMVIKNVAGWWIILIVGVVVFLPISVMYVNDHYYTPQKDSKQVDMIIGYCPTDRVDTCIQDEYSDVLCRLSVQDSLIRGLNSSMQKILKHVHNYKPFWVIRKNSGGDFRIRGALDTIWSSPTTGIPIPPTGEVCTICGEIK